MSGAFGHRRSVAEAREKLNREERLLDSSRAELQKRLDRYRAPLLIAAGLIGGFALTAAPVTLWFRAGGILTSGAARLVRSKAGPVFVGALCADLLSRFRGAAPNDTRQPNFGADP